jgi:hypothetical protein
LKAAAAIFVGVGIGAALLLVAFTSKAKPAAAEQPPAPTPGPSVPPAPAPEVTPKWFCEDVIGGDYDSSNGACRLPDGELVDGWQLLRGEIPGYPGGIPVHP